MKPRHILIIIIILGITGCKTPFGNTSSISSEPVIQTTPETSDIKGSLESNVFIATKTSDIRISSEPVIYITPVTKEVSASDEILLEIRVDNVSDLFATPFSITFDTNFLKFDGAAEGTFLNRNNADCTSFLFFNNTAKGRIVIGYTRMGQTSGVSGSGVLMTVKFKAIAKGTANISFSDAYAKGGNSSNLEIIPIDFIGTEICVN